MSAYRRSFCETKYIHIYFNKRWWIIRKVQWNLGKSLKKEFDSEPVYNEKYLKSKINSCNGEINTNFHNNKIPKEGSQFTCLSVNLIDSVFRTGKNYYPQVFLEECKYFVIKKKMPEHINDDIEISSDSDS